MKCQKCGKSEFKPIKTMKVEMMGGIVCAVHVDASICANIQCQAHTFTDEQYKKFREAVAKEYNRKKNLPKKNPDKQG